MESLESPIMHATDTKPICSTLPCGDNTNDELTKNLEDELLYGANEDVDEDDAQSDDSLRLRLSDDDVDDDIGASLPTDQPEQPEKTEPTDMEFDVHASNHCAMQHHENSSGMCSITSKHNGFKKELDLTDDHVSMKNNFSDTGGKNAFEGGMSQFHELNTGKKYTYKNEPKHSDSLKSHLRQANHSFPVNRSYSDHSYHTVVSNRYGDKYYNQNSHYGRCRGYIFGEFNTYFNSFGLERNYNLRVYPPSRKVLTEKKYVTPGSNSQTNVSAIENATDKDNSPSGINDTQHRIDNDTHIELNTTNNDSPQIPEPESSSDKLNASPNPEKISPPLSNENDTKENGIIDESDETITTCAIDESIDSQDKDAAEKLVHKPEIELCDVPIKAEVHDISENTTVASVDVVDASSKNSEPEEIEETVSSASNIVVPHSSDDAQHEETASNEKEPVVDTADENVSGNEEPTTLQKDDSDMVQDDDAVTVMEKNDDITETTPLPDTSEQDDNAESKEENKLGKKRLLDVSDDEKNVSKKIPCPESVVNERVSNSEVEVKESTSSEVPAIIEKPTNVETITENDTTTNKVDDKSEKLADINIKSESSEKTVTLPIEIVDDDENLEKDDDKLEITAVIAPSEVCTRSKRRRRKRKTNPMGDVVNSGQEKENVRQKRETAQKAEEIIRKRFLNSDSDSESSDSVPIFANNNKPNSRARPSSPPSLKRICPDEPVESTIVKKVKNELDTNTSSKTNETAKPSNNIKTLEQVRKFFCRDGKKSLSKFTQEELEELLIQKVIETITMRDEIGKLREQARISERNQEATRLKCQQLTKQIKDFEMVLNRFAADRRSGDKNVAPIKINRSVGLQVNFMTDNGIQNLRQLEHNMKTNATVVNGGNVLSKPSNDSSNYNSTSRKGIKVRSPRRTSDIPPLSPVSAVSAASTQVQSPVTSTVTPAALVVSKSTDNRHIINSGGQVVTQQGTITLNGALTATVRPSKVLNSRSSNSNNDNLIDLTGEEENKSKNLINPPPLTAITTSSTPAILQKAPPRYQRVIQPTPPNVTISQPAFKIVQSVDNKPMPTAIVNNMNNPRFALVMQNISGPRQLLMTTNTNTIRPAVTTHNRALLPGITYSGVQAISNGSVRVVPATASIQKHKHPAPLPGVTTYPVNAALKLPPPAPSLKISKVANGIVLSWNMRNSDEYAEIASYQLYAYQEVTGVAPSTALWKKVGDVRALPLPMACTLTQFSEGNNYYFAVRGVDTHSRLGQYSQPGNISL